MLREQALAPRLLLSGGSRGDGARVDVGVVGNLRVDRDRLAAGKPQHHVGATRAGLGADAGLHGEVDAVEQAGRFDQVAQLGLAPDATGRIVAQGGCERFRGRTQSLLRLGRGAQLLGELAVLAAALLLHVEHLLLHGAQRLLHRRQGLKNLPLGRALLRLSLGTLDGLPVLLLCHVQLLAESREAGLRGSELRTELGPPLLFVCLQLCERGRVPCLDHGGIRTCAAQSPGKQTDGSAEHGAGGESHDESEDGVHGPSITRASDITRLRTARQCKPGRS